jgi:hypothetical protein
MTTCPRPSACIDPILAIPFGATQTRDQPASGVNTWDLKPSDYEPRVEFTFF